MPTLAPLYDLPDLAMPVFLKAVDVGIGDTSARHGFDQALAENRGRALLRYAHEGSEFFLRGQRKDSITLHTLVHAGLDVRLVTRKRNLAG